MLRFAPRPLKTCTPVIAGAVKTGTGKGTLQAGFAVKVHPRAHCTKVGEPAEFICPEETYKPGATRYIKCSFDTPPYVQPPSKDAPQGRGLWGWDGMRWDGMGRDGIGWDGTGRDGIAQGRLGRPYNFCNDPGAGRSQPPPKQRVAQRLGPSARARRSSEPSPPRAQPEHGP